MRTSNRMIFLFLLPASALYLVFFLVPTIWSLYLSLYDWSGFQANMRYVGLDNYKQLFQDQMFGVSLKNTIVILIVGGVIVFGLALVITMFLNSGIRGKRLFKTVVFLPNVVSIVALTTLWGYIYNPNFGLLSGFLKLIGLPKLAATPWLGPDFIFGAMLIALVWLNVGFYVVLLAAGIEKIPVDFYEAAYLDGASDLIMFIRITIPLIWDVITVGMVLWTIGAMKLFEFPFAFTGLQQVYETYTVGTYIYTMGFGQWAAIFRLGYSSAMGVLLLLAVTLIVGILRRLMQREAVHY